MLRRAKAEGIPHNVLWDAKKLANVRSKKDPINGRSYWEIPALLDYAMGLEDGGWGEFSSRVNRRMKEMRGGTERLGDGEADDGERDDAA